MRPETASASDAGRPRAARTGLTALLALLLACGLLHAQEEKPEPAGPAKPGAGKEGAEEADETAPTSPVTAFFVKKALTAAGRPVEGAVILVRDGKIAEIGPEGDVEVPPFAERIERRDQVVCPGFVHPASLAFQRSNDLSTTGRANNADKSAREVLDPEFEEVGRIAASGFTTLAVIVNGGGVTGQAVLVRPLKKGDRDGLVPLADLVREEKVALGMAFARRTTTKKHFKDVLEKARKYIDDLAAWEKSGKGKEDAGKEKDAGKKGKKEEKAAKDEGEEKKEGEEKGGKDGEKDEKKEDEDGGEKDEKGGKKGADGKKKKDEKGGKKGADGKKKKDDEKKSETPTKPAEDPKVMPVVDVIEGRLPCILALDGAADFLHFQHLFEQEKAFRPVLLMAYPRASRGGSYGEQMSSSRMDAWRVADEIEELGVPVIMSTNIGTGAMSQVRRITQRILLDRGVPVALIPATSPKHGYRGFRFHLMELVRHGIPEPQVLRAVTLTPAEILGIQDRCGSLEKGKDADMVFFSGDPLHPLTRLLEVRVAGKTVYDRKEGES